MISLDNIYLEVEVEDDKSALSTIARLLHEKGYVKDGYEEALLRREAHSPTGLPCSPLGVALPHTDPEYVLKPCIIVMRLKDCVFFAEMGDPSRRVEVKYIFGLVFTDGKQQAPLLAKLVNMVTNEDVMQKLEAATQEKDVLHIVSAHV